MEAVHQHLCSDGLAGVAERHGGILEEDIPRLAGVHEHIGHRDALREQELGPPIGHRVRNGLKAGLEGGQGLLGSGDVDVIEPVAHATGRDKQPQGPDEQFLHNSTNLRKSLCFSVIISKILRIFA